MWKQVLSDAPLTVKAQARLVRTLPSAARLKPASDALAKFIGGSVADMAVPILDLD